MPIAQSLKSSHHTARYCIILLELLYRMLSEAHLLPKRLVQLICNDGSPILTLASTIARGFPLGRELGALQGVEFSENACGVLYELVGVVKQAQWPQAKKTKMSISWFVQSLFKNELMVRQSSLPFKCDKFCYRKGFVPACSATSLKPFLVLTQVKARTDKS